MWQYTICNTRLGVLVRMTAKPDLCAVATGQHHPTCRSQCPWDDLASNWQAVARTLANMLLVERKQVWRLVQTLEALQENCLSIGTFKEDYATTQTDRNVLFIWGRWIARCVYLCLVNSTMKTVVLLIKEQGELQRSQVGWKQHKSLQLLCQ